MYSIDTRIGTANAPQFSHGNCLPLTGVPFAMNYFSVQTAGENGSWWFHPDHRTWQGFRLTHQPSPWMGDFSHLEIQPVTGFSAPVKLAEAQSSYRPEESIFEPSQLQIFSNRYQIKSKLVPSCYGGILNLDYSRASENPGVLLQLSGRYFIEQINATTISGWVINFAGSEDADLRFYFVLQSDSPLELSAPNENSENTALITFSSTQVNLRFGTSFISNEQAALNLHREEDLSLADYLKNSRQQWQELFEKIEIQHHNQNEISTFAHNLYRLFLFPQRFYELDADNQPIHYNTIEKKSAPGILYTNNGFWDTYKTVYPLFSLLIPDLYGDMLEGFLNSYRESGFLPKWISPDERGLMPGTLIDAVIADAVAKNIRPDLWPELFTAMKKSATIQSAKENYGRRGTDDYLKYGYVPNTHHESVNHTLDYSYSDYCLSVVARALGENESAAFYQKQALNYRALFDKKSQLMRSKDVAGHFSPDFTDISWGGDYAEGSAWQSSFAVYQDFGGLIKQFGSEESFLNKLIELCNQAPRFTVGAYGFEIHEMSEMAALELGQLAISNQPSFHLPYLFSYVGHPEYAQVLLRSLMKIFNASPTGYPGDEDNGSMAGWYILNALGFYPVTPGSGEYVLGIPLFDQVTLHLPNGNDFVITATPNHPQQQFVEKIIVNEKIHTPLFITHETILAGGKLEFQLGIVPHPKTFVKSDYPFSLT
ncbi:GH92 family glycosyl hydrolase [Enterococcus timonensis]|uniref:GH92 family glycosyl hydrolase n=1 Tax=Enterococcus timonensis TaxID=1852364 RepID=UPI0008DB2FEF|nr:GH92 family glycosyl hydrolase [Enterococcus timonensis]